MTSQSKFEDRLKQSVGAWNEWRKDNEQIILDLSEAKLSAANLQGADLRWADLRGADLRDAILWGADLRGSNLSGANLGSADLSGANLIDANLSNTVLYAAHLTGANCRDTSFKVADLRGADMMGANLNGANLSSASLSGASLRSAKVVYTIFAGIDLSAARGLEAVRHLGPSTIGIDTIYRSKGQIPEHFLRGCGVPDDFITYVRTLTIHPVQFYSCFISYSSMNQDFAERLHTDLESTGVRCWFAPEDLKIGDKTRDRIDESIRLHDKLLLVLSASSVASQWVEHEVEAALERERIENRLVLFPIRLDDTVMETGTAWAANIRRLRNIGDFRNWKDKDEYQKAFRRVLRDLNSS
jgi:hypothetical protein